MTESLGSSGWAPHEAALGGVCGVLGLDGYFSLWWFRLLRWACGMCVLGGGREHE